MAFPEGAENGYAFLKTILIIPYFDFLQNSAKFWAVLLIRVMLRFSARIIHFAIIASQEYGFDLADTYNLAILGDEVCISTQVCRNVNEFTVSNVFICDYISSFNLAAKSFASFNLIMLKSISVIPVFIKAL